MLLHAFGVTIYSPLHSVIFSLLWVKLYFLVELEQNFSHLIQICSICQHGPDILVCDEAHIIKNTRADVTQALKQVKCQRRIALTGSPLQNNLMEYYCVRL